MLARSGRRWLAPTGIPTVALLLSMFLLTIVIGMNILTLSGGAKKQMSLLIFMINELN